MAQQHRSPASYIWPHLVASQPERREPQRERNLLAESMYPGHRTLAPKPKPPLTQSALQEAWRDHQLALAGLRRKR